MTKKELVKALSKYSDDMPVYISRKKSFEQHIDVSVTGVILGNALIEYTEFDDDSDDSTYIEAVFIL
jgi:hypothetical protein